MPSAGFLVITFIAALLIVAPSVVFSVHGWRSGSLGRAITIAALVLFCFMAWSAFTDPEASDFEPRAFSLYVTWGVTLYLGVALYACIWAIRGFFRKWHT